MIWLNVMNVIYSNQKDEGSDKETTVYAVL